MTLPRCVLPVPPQNPVDGAIVDVSALGVKLAYPDAPLAVRPACDRQITAKRFAHVEPSATHGSEFYPLGHRRDHHGQHLATDNVLRNDRSLSRSSRLTSRDGQRFEERQLLCADQHRARTRRLLLRPHFRYSCQGGRQQCQAARCLRGRGKSTPAANGRVEGPHRTLQDRLVKELRLRGISRSTVAFPQMNRRLPRRAAPQKRVPTALATTPYPTFQSWRATRPSCLCGAKVSR